MNTQDLLSPFFYYNCQTNTYCCLFITTNQFDPISLIVSADPDLKWNDQNSINLVCDYLMTEGKIVYGNMWDLVIREEYKKIHRIADDFARTHTLPRYTTFFESKSNPMGINFNMPCKIRKNKRSLISYKRTRYNFKHSANKSTSLLSIFGAILMTGRKEWGNDFEFNKALLSD